MGRGSSDKLILIHPTRLQIYKIICESPGTYFYRLMSALPNYVEKISSATLIYHLQKLSEEKLIDTTKIDGKRIYFPINLRDSEIERAYMLLNNENAKKIFLYVVNKDNAFQNEIARALNLHHDTIYYHIQHLCDAGLIEKEKEGKFARFHIGQIGKKLLEGSLNVITEEYIHFILSKLEDHCHFPEVLEKTKTHVKIRVVCPNEDDIEIEIRLKDFDFSLNEISKEI